MKKRTLPYILLCALVCASQWTAAALYHGRVVDEQGHGIGYATVYPKSDPVAGTATNMDGYFTMDTELPTNEDIIISFIGYEKKTITLDQLNDSTIVLHEQPIALEETVVAAKKSKQRNKRKAIAQLLHQVYNRMEEDFSDNNVRYRIVSDVRMDSEGEAWGMEQMIATIVTLPEARKNGSDSVQFHGEYCKRYFRQDLRQRADTLLAGKALESFDSKKQKHDFRQAVNAVDSGVVVHRSLWAMGNIKYDLQSTANDLKKWSVSNESEGETVLTYVEKHNYLGIFKMEHVRNYILDSYSLSVRRYSEQAEFWVNIPFGLKLDENQLQLLNMLNMGEQEIEKFRVRKAHAKLHMNTIYQWQNGHIYPLERNLQTDAEILGTKKAEIPIQIRATQRAVKIETENVQPMKKQELTRRLRREIVPIY